MEDIIELIAKEFSKSLLEEIGIDLYPIAKESHLNITGECCTHIYCDANMVMFEAMRKVVGLEGNGQIQEESLPDGWTRGEIACGHFTLEQAQALSKAWERARENNFYVTGTAGYHEWYAYVEEEAYIQL